MGNILLVVIYLLIGVKFLDGQEGFSCIYPVENDDSNECSTLKLHCKPDQKIKIRNIHNGLRKSNKQCSYNATVCKKLGKGCCASSGFNDIESVPLKKNIQLLKRCFGQENCSLTPLELASGSSKYKHFLMVEYLCVKATRIINMCDETDVLSTFTNDSIIDIIHAKSYRKLKQLRRCSCDISASNTRTSVNVTLKDIRLMDTVRGCTPTRLQISDTLQLGGCSELSGLFLEAAGSFSFTLDYYLDHPPDFIWISVKGDQLNVKCSSSLYANGTANETTTDEKVDCPGTDYPCSLLIIIMVPIGAVVLVGALLVVGFIIRRRMSARSGTDINQDKKQENTQIESPFYHTLESVTFEDGERNSRQQLSTSETNTDIKYPAAASALEQTVSSYDSNAIKLDAEIPPRYERISITTLSEPIVRYSQCVVEQPSSEDSVANETTNGAEMKEVEVVQIKQNNDFCRTNYDKLTFSKPVNKIPHYTTTGQISASINENENRTSDLDLK